MTPKQREAIRRHGETLLKLFPHATIHDPERLCKRLRRIEQEAHKLAEDACNGYVQADYDEFSAAIMEKLDAVLAYQGEGVPVFHNGDPRGYALKINDSWTANHAPSMHRDWGGYGIIAPEIDSHGRG